MVKDKPRFSTPSNLPGEPMALKNGSQTNGRRARLISTGSTSARKRSCRWLPTRPANREPCHTVTRYLWTEDASSSLEILRSPTRPIWHHGVSRPLRWCAIPFTSTSVFPRLQMVTTSRFTVTQKHCTWTTLTSDGRPTSLANTPLSARTTDNRRMMERRRHYRGHIRN